jgi:hypothetical protein
MRQVSQGKQHNWNNSENAHLTLLPDWCLTMAMVILFVLSSVDGFFGANWRFEWIEGRVMCVKFERGKR